MVNNKIMRISIPVPKMDEETWYSILYMNDGLFTRTTCLGFTILVQRYKAIKKLPKVTSLEIYVNYSRITDKVKFDGESLKYV